MDLVAGPIADYLDGDDVIETTHPDVVGLAAALGLSCADDVAYAETAYVWVRDKVVHSWDAQDPRPTVTASEVLRERVGLCFAKSHLYVALLRAQGIPAGLCYQRLGSPQEGYWLHGLAAVHLAGRWHRQDVRGNNDRVDAAFRLDREQLAWPVDPGRGELDYPQVHVAAAPIVLEALRGASDMVALCRSGLPERLDA